MTIPGVEVALARMEGKIDTLSVKVEAGDKAATSLVDIVKAELRAVQESVEDLKRTVVSVESRTDKALSTVRVSLEGQVTDLRKDMDLGFTAEETHRSRIYGRLDRNESRLSWIMGVGAAITAILGALGTHWKG